MILRKAVLYSLFLLLILTVSAYANATSEESWIMPHSTVNNDNHYWDVSQSLNPAVPTTSDFSSNSTNALFRIRTNYSRKYTDEKYRKVTITPDSNGFYFVSDSNPSVKRKYSFVVYQIGFRRDLSISEPSPINGAITNHTLTENIGNYSFVMNSATWGRTTMFTPYFTSRFYDYEVYLKLPELNSSESSALVPGSYHATFTVNLYTGSDGGVLTPVTYTIKGYYGESGSSNTDFSFVIGEATYSYGVDLTNYSTYFDVATLAFNVNATDTTWYNIDEDDYSDKYTILISPFSRYQTDANVTTNPYMFILNGTENSTRTEFNTVWYDIYNSNSGGVFSKSGDYNHVYQVRPSFDVDGQRQNWILKWTLNQPIYIKPIAPEGEGVTPAAGFYHTTLYFFVITK